MSCSSTDCCSPVPTLAVVAAQMKLIPKDQRAYFAWLRKQEERLACDGKRPARIQVLEVRTDPTHVEEQMRARRRAIFSVDGAKEQQQKQQTVNRRPMIDDCADPLGEFDRPDEVEALATRLEATDMNED